MGVGPCLWVSAELQEPQLLLLAVTSAPSTSTSQIMMGAYFVFTFLLFNSIFALPPNFEDIDLASDQPDGEVVDINQADPQSNAIHVAHNIPKDSDITVVQSNPFNCISARWICRRRFGQRGKWRRVRLPRRRSANLRRRLPGSVWSKGLWSLRSLLWKEVSLTAVLNMCPNNT